LKTSNGAPTFLRLGGKALDPTILSYDKKNEFKFLSHKIKNKTISWPKQIKFKNFL